MGKTFHEIAVSDQGTLKQETTEIKENDENYKVEPMTDEEVRRQLVK